MRVRWYSTVFGVTNSAARDLLVRAALRHAERDLHLPGREVLARGVAVAASLAARAELGLGPLRPCVGAQPLEDRERAVELLASRAPLARSPEPLPEAEPRACLLERQPLAAGGRHVQRGERALEGGAKVLLQEAPAALGRRLLPGRQRG